MKQKDNGSEESKRRKKNEATEEKHKKRREFDATKTWRKKLSEVRIK